MKVFFYSNWSITVHAFHVKKTELYPAQWILEGILKFVGNPVKSFSPAPWSNILQWRPGVKYKLWINILCITLAHLNEENPNLRVKITQGSVVKCNYLHLIFDARISTFCNAQATPVVSPRYAQAMLKIVQSYGYAQVMPIYFQYMPEICQRQTWTNTICLHYECFRQIH